MPERNFLPCLEYKSADGAWYEVSLKLQNGKLIIHFEGDFADAGNEEFSLENVRGLQDLEAEFRLPSRQLIDTECEMVKPGMIVCASRTVMDRRTFDARVEKVIGSKFKHISVDGEEQCNCIYEVIWLAGPYKSERTSIYCENIHLLQSKKIQKHPVIKDVVKYLDIKTDCKSQVAIKASSQTNMEKIRNTVRRSMNSQEIKLTDNTERIMNSCWPSGVRQVIEIEEESGELKLKPTNFKEMEGLEEGFSHRPNIESNILQKLFSNNDRLEYLDPEIIYGIPGNCVLNGEDARSSLCYLKQENKDTLAAACKSEGGASERNSIACLHSLIGDAKNGFGGWIDDDSPRVWKNYGGIVEGNSDKDCSYFSRTRDANLVNRNKEFSENWLGNCNKSPALVKFIDENVDMQTDVVIVSPPISKVRKNLDVAKNERVMNACTVFSEYRSGEPNFTNKSANSSHQICVKSTGCEKHHNNFCRNCCPCCTYFHVSPELCVECGRYRGHISMNVCRRRRGEELRSQQNLFSFSHVILLENLDRDVNPSDVLSIILQAGVNFVKVYVSLPQSFENFTRAIVCFKDQESFQKVSAYLQNENIIVTSSKGRPWVVMDIDAENVLSEGSFGGFAARPKCCKISSNKVKICWRGTPEYERAKRLKGNFLEWWKDLKQLHQTLANDETAL